MRDLVKIYKDETIRLDTFDMLCERKLKAQIGRHDITILNITRVQNIKENCSDCYVDYEFWGGK